MNKEELILEFLKLNPASFIEIRNHLSKKTNQRINNKKLDATLKELQAKNKIYFKRKQEKYFLKDEKSDIGTFKETRHRYGFVELESGLSVFIPEKFTHSAINGDSVKIIYFPQRPDDDPERKAGKIVRIVKRNGDNIILRVKKDKEKIYLEPDEIESKYKYELVSKRIYPVGTILVANFNYFLDGVVYVKLKKILGTEHEPLIDYLVVAYKNNIPLTFSEESIKEALKIKDLKNSLENRVDYRNLFTYTIDGASSKDLDDAISIEEAKKGYKLYVHIADVSHFVKEGSSLDYEAYKRCNSIYLIDKVFPMLPEILSNELCSLKPNADKLTLTCEMNFDFNGNLKSYNVVNSIINSNYRLTYEEVDDFLKEKIDLLREDKKLSNSLLLAKKFSLILRKNKINNGMIDFSLPELKIDLDNNGYPTKIWNKFQTESEKIIEDLMVAANQSVAKFLNDKKIEGIFRAHEKPKPDNVLEFLNLAKTFVTEEIKSYENLNQKWFIHFLDLIKDKNYEIILKRSMIQSMEKAIYTKESIGHYALGIKEYLHFTSPIRRYADLVVHRNIKKYIENKNYFKQNSNPKLLDEIALECSKKEREAAHIERKLKDIKSVRFVKNEVNKETEATIVSFSKFGIYAQLDNLVSGMIKFDSISNFDFSYNEETFQAIDKTKNYKLNLGEKIKVKINNLDLARGQINFDLITDYYENNS